MENENDTNSGSRVSVFHIRTVRRRMWKMTKLPKYQGQVNFSKMVNTPRRLVDCINVISDVRRLEVPTIYNMLLRCNVTMWNIHVNQPGVTKWSNGYQWINRILSSHTVYTYFLEHTFWLLMNSAKEVFPKSANAKGSSIQKTCGDCGAFFPADVNCLHCDMASSSLSPILSTPTEGSSITSTSYTQKSLLTYLPSFANSQSPSGTVLARCNSLQQSHRPLTSAPGPFTSLMSLPSYHNCVGCERPLCKKCLEKASILGTCEKCNARGFCPACTIIRWV